MSTEQWTEATSKPLCYYNEILEFHRVPLSLIISDFKHFVELPFSKKVLEFIWWLETVQGRLCIQLNQIGLFDKIVNVENFFIKKAIREISFLHLEGKAA